MFVFLKVRHPKCGNEGQKNGVRQFNGHRFKTIRQQPLKWFAAFVLAGPTGYCGGVLFFNLNW
nr:MAG TPA: hypothetical protein [Caudoviricetes sp.]